MTYKSDFTDATPSATVHAAGHNDVARGLAAAEADLDAIRADIAALQAAGGGGGGGAMPVDITLTLAGTLESHKRDGAMPSFGFYVPRDFVPSYFTVYCEGGPTGGPVDVVLIANNAPFWEATIPANRYGANVVGHFNRDYTDDTTAYAGFGGLSIMLSYNSGAVTNLGHDWTIRLGGGPLGGGPPILST